MAVASWCDVLEGGRRRAPRCRFAAVVGLCLFECGRGVCAHHSAPTFDVTLHALTVFWSTVGGGDRVTASVLLLLFPQDIPAKLAFGNKQVAEALPPGSDLLVTLVLRGQSVVLAGSGRSAKKKV